MHLYRHLMKGKKNRLVYVRDGRAVMATMASYSSQIVRARYAARDVPAVRLPEHYEEEMRHAEAARRLREAYVEEVANSCRSVAKVPLLESDGVTKTLDFMKAYLRRDDAVLNVKRRGVPFLSKIIMHDEMDVLELLLQDPRVDVNVVFEHQGGMTALIDACVNGDTDAVRLLLQRDDLDVNAQDDEGRTALYEAAWQGDIDVVRMLVLDNRVNLDVRAGVHKWTAADAAMTSFVESFDAAEFNASNDERYNEFLAVVRLLVADCSVDFEPKKMAELLKRKDERQQKYATPLRY